MTIVFASSAPKKCRCALEKLLFLNPRQQRVRNGILNSLEQFGQPLVEETGGGLTVRLGDHAVQNLFAFDRDRHRTAPVGVVIFLRITPVALTVIHIAVHPAYSLKGLNGEMGLGLALVEKVKEIAKQIVGVNRVDFFYRQEVRLRI